ncbi:hypothetical protein EDD66_107152 [Mobilisporobacter senegalensis]|uniref:Uncharacterized protein n=1 Tax=Mobilisporobacter senegalensis TaxID=1329262 RepID=A0A3N1XM36_9FIRM|nr:DUF6320 domain-containing protein [Mobilisporobacter senegalensis]ROR27238.1 hypothetical protein EDD66_107152 [Mobilisporobacter senegalensis]
MQYCKHCQVHVRGKRETCPLCMNLLTGREYSDDLDLAYPEIPLTFEGHLVIRIILFISIISIVISFVFNRVFPSHINWPVFVVFGLVSMWLSLIAVMKKKHNIPKTIMWQVTIVSALSIFWDYETKWRGWSINYVIPITLVLAMLIMYITAKIMKLGVRDYILYFLLDGLFGIIPVGFILFDWISTIYPSILCVTVSIIFTCAIIIFQGENIKNEFNRRMHI